MTGEALGRWYEDGEAIVEQGEKGDCMYVVQEGAVEVSEDVDGKSVHLADLGPGDFFGEMALFSGARRSATVRAKGRASVLTVDKRTLLSRVQQDPSMAFNIMQKMSERIGFLDQLYGRIRAGDRRDWETRPERWEGEREK